MAWYINMGKNLLKGVYIAVYAVGAAFLAWRYLFSGGDWTVTAAIIALIAGFIVQTVYNVKYKPRP